nr:hypothetical protein [Schaalia odontolytica]
MKIHVDQAGQGEGVGGGEVRSQRCARVSGVLDDGGHEASSSPSMAG